jgi:hypothetical protein
MKRFYQIFFLLCGILTIAAFPVFAQDEKTQEVKINVQPLRDLGAFVKEKVDKGEIDLTQPFKVVLEGVLTKDGRLDATKSKFVTSEGDEQMLQIAKTAIEAYSNTGILVYLRNFGIEKVKVTLMQDQTNFSAAVESEQANEEKAKTLASRLNSLLTFAKMVSKNEDDKTIWSGFQTPTTSGKTVVLNFALPAKTVQDMIQRNLKRVAEPEKWKAGE